jgi:hypothetical protein
VIPSPKVVSPDIDDVVQIVNFGKTVWKINVHDKISTMHCIIKLIHPCINYSFTYINKLQGMTKKEKSKFHHHINLVVSGQRSCLPIQRVLSFIPAQIFLLID